MSTHNIGFYTEAILMSTHNIGFYEELTKIIFQLLSNIHFISSECSYYFDVLNGLPMILSLWTDI